MCEMTSVGDAGALDNQGEINSHDNPNVSTDQAEFNANNQEKTCFLCGGDHKTPDGKKSPVSDWEPKENFDDFFDRNPGQGQTGTDEGTGRESSDEDDIFTSFIQQMQEEFEKTTKQIKNSNLDDPGPIGDHAREIYYREHPDKKPI